MISHQPPGTSILRGYRFKPYRRVFGMVLACRRMSEHLSMQRLLEVAASDDLVFSLEEFHRSRNSIRRHPGSRYRHRPQRDALHPSATGEVSQLQKRSSRRDIGSNRDFHFDKLRSACRPETAAEHSWKMVGIRLLVAQRHQRIHFGGTSGGHITGEGGDCDEHRGDGSHGHRIVRADVV